MEKRIDKDLVGKFKAVAQGPDADLLREFLNMLYYRHEEHDHEPLTEEDWAAIREGKEAIRRGEFLILEEFGKRTWPMSYSLHIDKTAVKTIKGLDRTTIERIYKRLKELAKAPLDSRISYPLEMSQKERKSRVGNWRIFYEIDDDTLTVNITAVRPRGRAYRKF